MMRTLSCVVLALLWGSAVDARSVAQADEPIVKLAGRWAGQGIVTPSSGPSESFKCVITYFPSEDGSQVKQNLRCRGVNYRFDAATHLNIEDRRVKGKWTDNIYSLSGTVAGTVTDSGFDIMLLGSLFTAKMTVVSSNCEQSIVVIPEQKTEMKELAAILKRC